MNNTLVFQGTLLLIIGTIIIGLIIFLKKEDNTVNNIVNFFKAYKNSQADRKREKQILISLNQKNYEDLLTKINELQKENTKLKEELDRRK